MGEQLESTNVESVQMETPVASETSYEQPAESANTDIQDGNGTESYEEASTTIASATSEEGTSFELFTDPATGKVEFRATKKTTEPAEPEEESEEAEEQQESTEGLSQQQEYTDAYNNATVTPNKYTLDEFSYALANGIVDERRVPDEYQTQYADYKIAQARMAYTQRIQAEEAQRQQLAQQMQQESTPEAKIAANEAFYKNLETEATRLAMQDLGITQEEIDDSAYADDGGVALKANLETAKNWHKQRLMNELQNKYNQEQAYKAQQQQIYKEIGDYTNYLQATEPHFAQIDKMLATAWQEMPTKYGAVVQQALNSLAQGTVTRQQAQVIQKYFEDTRRLFYAKQQGLSKPNTPQPKKKPPVVEKPGDGRNAVSDKGPDYSALRKADARGKKAWLADFFKGIEL